MFSETVFPFVFRLGVPLLHFLHSPFFAFHIVNMIPVISFFFDGMPKGEETSEVFASPPVRFSLSFGALHIYFPLNTAPLPRPEEMGHEENHE